MQDEALGAASLQVEWAQMLGFGGRRRQRGSLDAWVLGVDGAGSLDS